MTDVTVVIAGQAGQGVDTASELLARALVRSGYYVFSCPDVMSRIRGGHNFTAVRISDRPRLGSSGSTSLLLALDEASIALRRPDVMPGGIVVAPGKADTATTGETPVRVPTDKLAGDLGAPRAMANTVGLGALFGFIGHPLRPLLDLLDERFAAKGRDAVRLNQACARAGFKFVTPALARSCPCAVPALKKPARRLLLSGSHAIALGALCSGVQFFSGYPMSPATPIMEYLAGKQQRFGLLVEQAEDELAAVNQVLGASYAGARAMTATSGGGFALMVEGLGLAGMAELPCVIVLAQRPGPATGFPTRTEQAELLFAISASGDDFPRFVFAPGSAEQAFGLTRRAFCLAEKYQVPAILLSDQFLSDSLWTVPDLSPAETLQTEDETARLWRNRPPLSYHRYSVTDDGVSPKLRPGIPNQIVRSIGSEHDEDGLQIESSSIRTRMHDKRMRKLSAMAQEVDLAASYPCDDAEHALVCFGSTLGPVREAVDLLRAERVNVNAVHLSELCPFPRESVVARLSACRHVITVENNSTGQLGRLLCRETRIAPEREVLKYDGRPFTGSELAEQLKKVMQ